MEPRYTLSPNMMRVFVPQVAIIMLLCGALFTLLILNFEFVYTNVPALHQYLALAGCALLCIILTVVYYIKDKKVEYQFYDSYVDIGGVSTMYSEIVDIDHKKGTLDNMFNTCTILLKPEVSIPYVSDSNSVYFKVQKLIQMSRRVG